MIYSFNLIKPDGTDSYVAIGADTMREFHTRLTEFLQLLPDTNDYKLAEPGKKH